MKISRGKIRLENKVIDLATFRIRPKVTEQDLERYYDEFLAHAEEIRDYFEDREGFDRALRYASEEKQPKLVARNPRYPFMWVFRKEFASSRSLNPERRLHDEYFTTSRLLIAMPTKRKIQEEKPCEKEKPLDQRLREDIAEKFKQYPGYEGIIEIPNDRTPPETKSSIFHNSLHYLLSRYWAETGREVSQGFIRGDLSPLEKYGAKYLITERSVEILTDKLLMHDPDAQFEARWPFHSLNSSFVPLAMMGSGVGLGLLVYASLIRPYLFPLLLAPGIIRDYALEKYKQSKKEEILAPREYPEFKI